MRSALKNALDRDESATTAHPGLLYERYVPLIYGDEAPAKPDEKTPKIGTIRSPDDREKLLRQVAAIPVSEAYRTAFRRWRATVQPPVVTYEVETTGRLLLGHGNPAPTEVGLTLHHVYGVPILTGTALKGLLSHYLASWGGPEWRGLGYDEDGRPAQAPSDYHGTLFGVPNLRLADGQEQEGKAGGVLFEDAWLMPGKDDRPLCVDVLTPHQDDYYGTFGEGAFPNDWTDPNPVTFLTVKPGTRFLLAISPALAGRECEGAALAMAHLLDALEEWGLGAKTFAGYGRLRRVDARPDNTAKGAARLPPGGTASHPRSEALIALGEAVAAVLDPPDRDRAPPITERLTRHITDALLDAVPSVDRGQARQTIEPLLRHAGLRKRRQERLNDIEAKVSQ